MSQLETVIILGLAVVRVSYFIARENAPFHTMAKIREAFSLGGLLDCMYCVSVWATPVIALLWMVDENIVILLAVMGLASVLFRWSGLDYEVQ